MIGRLIKYVGGLGTVLQDNDEVIENITLRGIYRKDDIKPLVGDIVRVSDERIDEILPRRNALKRPPIANVDCLLLVLSQAPPTSDAGLADSLTVTAEYNNIDVVIAVNKADIDEGKIWRERYALTGYPVFTVSAETGQGIDELRTALHGKTIVLAGKSGVGKSSLLNALFPGLALTTGEISRRLRLGKHTTRHVELLPYDGGYIADTPGFTIYDPDCITGMTPNELAECYPEMRPYIGQCKFRKCRHERDEGCAILQAIADGKVHEGRHATYCKLVEMLV